MTVHSFSGCWLHSVLNDDTAWVSTDEMCINVNMMDVISDALGIGTIDCNCICYIHGSYEYRLQSQ